MANYHYEPLAQLAQHCAYTPRERRLEQLGRIRELAASLKSGKTYPYDFVLYHIIGLHIDGAKHALFETTELRADLIALILDVSDSLDLPVAWADEPVLTLDDVRRTYDVSLKTVRRWRAQGLVAFRFVLPNGRKRTAIRQSDLEAFVDSHPDTIRRTGAYAYIDAESRRAILARAFEVSLNEALTLDEAVGRLAREFAASHRAVRLLLTRYDRKHPDTPIFATPRAPLTDEERRQILALYRSGRSAIELGREFLLGRSAVARLVRELVVEDLLGQKWHYVPSTEFDGPNAEEAILADPPAEDLVEDGVVAPLCLAEERALFRQYNFLKRRLAMARDELAPSQLDDAQVERLVRLHERAMAVRNRLVLANLRLVVHHSGRHLGAGSRLDELVSDGTVSLMNAIEQFDYQRGVRFSTYASWAILKNFAKTIPRELEARRAVSENSQDIVESTADKRSGPNRARDLRDLLRSLVASMLLELSEREREVVVARFGLGDREAQTLEQIGRRFDITRERVRQIEARALRKLAAVADPAILEELAAPRHDP